MSEQWKDDLEAVGGTIESLRNELAAARAQVEKEALEMGGVIHDLRRELARTTDSFLVTQARAQAAEARAEAAEKDAGRYRWLRVQPHADIAACWYIPVLPQDYPVDTPEQRDAAIDAAIAEGK